MSAKVHSPSGALEECAITELEQGLCRFVLLLVTIQEETVTMSSVAPPDKYAIRFIPRENGLHTIDVKFNDTHIPGSPFQVRVGEPGQSGDPGLVSVYGSGLERGTTGRILVRELKVQMTVM